METPPDPKLLMPDKRWQKLFTGPWLKSFVPQRGSYGDPLPILEAHFLDYPSLKDGLAIMALEGEHWNESAELRQEVVFAIGREMAERHWKVYAMRIATAAWMREFTREEEAARHGRNISDYEDKVESMIVVGSTMDQRQQLVHARIHRDTVGRVRAVGNWERYPLDAKLDFYLLEAAWAGYMRRYLELHNPTLLALADRVHRDIN